MIVYLVLFKRNYTLKRIVVKAEDVEITGVGGEPDQGNGEGNSEERTNGEPSNDNGDDDDIKTVDVDEKLTLEGHEVDIKRLESQDV